MGFLYSMTYLYDKTLNGLGLMVGGTLTRLDGETLHHIAALMTEKLPTAIVTILGPTSIAIVSISVLTSWITRASPRPGNVA